MAYQETKTTGYATRLSNSMKGIGSGFVLLLAGSVLLWWNEGRSIKTTKMLEEAQGVTVHVEDVSKVDPSYNGKLIHATAFTQTTDSLSDATFGVGAIAVKLNRNVQYYQWVEEEKTEKKDKVGGSVEEVTTYSYRKEWVDGPVDSQDFKDQAYREKNFTVMNVEGESYLAGHVTFGAYQLSENLIRSISGAVPMELNFSEEQLKLWNRDIKSFFEDRVVQSEKSDATVTNGTDQAVGGDSVQVENTVNTDADMSDKANFDYVHVNNNVLYFGKNPNNPQIGDMSVTFTKVLPGEVSVIAEINGDKLQSYVSKNGKQLSMLRMGSVSMEEMYQSKHSQNSIMTWLMRIVGLLVVIGSLKSIFRIVTTLLKVLPFLADIAELGVRLVCNVLGLVWSLLVIALAWVFYRPVVAGVLLVVIVALIVFLMKRGKDKKKTDVITTTTAA